jgi:regulator of sirC expression with transglutaminase-like and TPR domain
MLQKVRAAFVQEVAKGETHINLAYAALLISEYLTGAADIGLYLALLDEMADAAQPLVRAANSNKEALDAFNRYMFGELQFTGNSIDYYIPDNSFLNKVLETKVGIPITLSVIYIEVAQRLGLPVWGIGMPGHFIVGYGDATAPTYVDVFDRGHILSEDDCLAICNVSPANRLRFRNQFLKAAAKKSILFRMLLNLKQIYVKQEAWELAHKTVDFMVLIRPGEVTEIRDRGLLAYRLDRLQEAMFDIKRYLFLEPDSLESSWLKKRVETIEEQLTRLN